MLPTASQLIYAGAPYMPLKLKGVLTRHGILQRELSDAIKQTGPRTRGRPLSHPAITIMLNWDQWPLTTSKADIKRQAEDFLRFRNIPEDEIAVIWEVDVEDEYRHAKPLSENSRRRKKKKPRHHTEAPPANEFDKQIPENEMLSQNARKHFKIFMDPFIDDVQSPEDVFLSSEQRYIRDAMWQTAKHGGFLAVVGESGAGKTVLRRDLLERIKIEGHNITAIQPRIIDKGRLTAGLICDAIIRDISVSESIYGSLEAKARKIETLLIGSSRAGNAHVLIIEEAHDLHVKTLKYLKRFWELEDGFKKLLSIILIGQPELRDNLDERMNWEAREVIRRCEVAELEPLNGSLEEYLELKFTRVGAKLNQVFEKKAFDAIRERLTLTRRGDNHPISMHYPLIVNNTVVKCMNLAADIGSPKVTAEIVLEV